jgi:hypothetical protein
MNKTRKILCYTGIGARKNGKHSIKNFRKITRKLYSRAKCNSMKKNKKKYGYGSECPKNTNNNGWVNFFGADYMSPEKCNSIDKSRTN